MPVRLPRDPRRRPKVDPTRHRAAGGTVDHGRVDPLPGSVHPLDADPTGILGTAPVQDVAPADRADRRITATDLDGRRPGGRDVGVGRAAGPADSIGGIRGLTPAGDGIREERVGRTRLRSTRERRDAAIDEGLQRSAFVIRRRAQQGDRHWFATGPDEGILVEVADGDPGDDERRPGRPDRQARRQVAVGAAPRPQAVAVRDGLLRLHHPPPGQLPRAGATRGERVMTVGKRQE